MRYETTCWCDDVTVVKSSSLSHVLLCAGSVAEWAVTDHTAWHARLELVAQAAHTGGASWATIVPTSWGEHGAQSADPHSDSSLAEQIRVMLVATCGGVRYGNRVVLLCTEGVTVIVDPNPDGQQRIAQAAEQVAGDITEDRLSAALRAPAPSDPDLVVVLGSSTQMPSALVWELAYAELVFLDAPWSSLDAEHLEMAIDDFTRRDRRFGGVDS